MSTHEDRIGKLENALTTLAELAAKADTRMDRTETRMDRTDEQMVKLEDLVTRLAQATTAGFADINAKINALVDSHIRLTESQARTDESLRNLMAAVDRYFSEGGGNGKA